MILLAILISAAIGAPAGPSAVPPVHGEGVLTADRGTMASGEGLDLSGRGFAPGESYQLKLVGVLQEFGLATARVGPDSTFALSVTIPADAREGSYRIEAIAEDGDVSAALDVTLLAAVPVPNDRSTEPMAGMEHTTGAMARADEIPINRTQSGAAWAVIGGLIGLAAGLGAGLLSRGRLGAAGS